MPELVRPASRGHASSPISHYSVTVPTESLPRFTISRLLMAGPQQRLFYSPAIERSELVFFNLVFSRLTSCSETGLGPPLSRREVGDAYLPPKAGGHQKAKGAAMKGQRPGKPQHQMTYRLVAGARGHGTLDHLFGSHGRHGHGLEEWPANGNHVPRLE
jgi:hypothetical protein